MKYLILILLAFPLLLQAMDISGRDGWTVVHTDRTYKELIEVVKESVEASGLSVITESGPTEAAAKRDIEIPGNCVIGVFNNDYAVQILALSTAAMIEAPIRLYVTENDDETASLSWKNPSFVFEPYYDEGGKSLRDLTAKLDTVFDEIGKAVM